VTRTRALTAPNVSGMVVAGVLLIASMAVSAADVEAPGHEHAALPVDESFTMVEAVDIALANYPTSLELAARSAQAEAWTDRGKSWLAGRPSATLRYQTDRWDSDNNLDEYEGGVLLPLWNWGGRAAVKKLGNAFSVESGAADSALRWEVAGLVRNALWTIALAESDHELAEQVLDMAASLTASVERRYELGDVALGDVLLAQSSNLDAQTNLIEAAAMLLDAERAYRSLTGLERRPPFHGEVLSGSQDVAPDHPALVFANAEVSRAEAGLAVAEQSARSGTSLLIGPRSERPAFGNDFDDSIGITVSIPFGGSSHRRAATSAAVRVAAAARSAHAHRVRALTLAMHEAAHGLDVVHQNLAATSERRDLAERHLVMAESAYEKGELELIDLLKVQTSAISAARQVARLQIDEKRQTAFYNQAVGKLP